MSQEFWKTDKFKESKDIWDKILEEEGLGELDNKFTVTNDKLKYMNLSSGTRRRHELMPEYLREHRRDYYLLMLRKFLEETEFEDDLDKLIMERTIQGKKIKEISLELKGMLADGRQRSKHNRDTIRYVRRRYEKKWGIRDWNQQDLVSRKAKKLATR